MDAGLEALSAEELGRRKLAAEVAKIEFEAALLRRPWRSSQFYAAMLGGLITVLMGGFTFWQGTVKLGAAEAARREVEAQLRRASEENTALREQAKRLQTAAEDLARAGEGGASDRSVINQAYVASAQVLAQSSLAATPATRPVVYLQFGEASDSELAARLREGLRASGRYVVPPAERVGAVRLPGATEVRYFRNEDAAAAQALADELGALGQAAQVVSLAGKPIAAQAKPGTLEVWLGRDKPVDKRLPAPVAPGSPRAY